MNSKFKIKNFIMAGCILSIGLSLTSMNLQTSRALEISKQKEQIINNDQEEIPLKNNLEINIENLQLSKNLNREIKVTSRGGLSRDINKEEEKINDQDTECVNPEKKEEPKQEEVQETKPVVNDEAIEQTKAKSQNVQTVSKETTQFVGKVTHYGPDCSGCSGNTASGYNVKNTTTYNDSTYGSVRIVAAPKEIPLYSILKLKNYKGGEMTVIVLDRGGAIKGTKFDILVSSEKEAINWGIQNNVEFEILRWGR